MFQNGDSVEAFLHTMIKIFPDCRIEPNPISKESFTRSWKSNHFDKKGTFANLSGGEYLMYGVHNGIIFYTDWINENETITCSTTDKVPANIIAEDLDIQEKIEQWAETGKI